MIANNKPEENIQWVVDDFKAKYGQEVGLPSQSGAKGFLSKTISNVPKSAYEFGKAMVTPIIHPLQTGENIFNIAKGVAEKAISGTYPDHGKYAEGVWNFFVDRYEGI